MLKDAHRSFAASDRSYFALIKKEIHKLAVEANLSPQKVAHIDIIISEMTSNLMKYAKDGEILVNNSENDKGTYLEIISIDNGPGIKDIVKMSGDGVSTSNTIGHGLGSIRRLSDDYDAYSIPGWGTIVLSRIYIHHQETGSPLPEVYALNVPKPGETLSGDGLILKYEKSRLRLMLMDGLGHGPDAHHAVAEADKVFSTLKDEDPVMIIRTVHEKIRKSRGGVGTVMIYNTNVAAMHIAGIGNISGKVYGLSSTRNVVPYNGIIGHNIPTSMSMQVYPAADYHLMILCSDGIKSRWDIARYTAISRYDPAILAAAIYKDFGRRTDDMSVVIVKLKKL